jgi:hypothetical protein
MKVRGREEEHYIKPMSDGETALAVVALAGPSGHDHKVGYCFGSNRPMRLILLTAKAIINEDNILCCLIMI